MVEENIRGVLNAAKHVKLSNRTVYRLMEKEEFPKSINGIHNGIKVWTKFDLDKFRKSYQKNKKKSLKKKNPLKNKIKQQEEKIEQQEKKIEQQEKKIEQQEEKIEQQKKENEELKKQVESGIANVRKRELVRLIRRRCYDMQSLRIGFCQKIAIPELFKVIKQDFSALRLKKFKEILEDMYDLGVFQLHHAYDKMKIDPQYLVRNRYMISL